MNADKFVPHWTRKRYIDQMFRIYSGSGLLVMRLRSVVRSQDLEQ